MNKMICAGIVLAACGQASAQSSVTVWGVMDAGVARVSASGRGHTFGVMTGGNSTSRIAFRGVEDLGGGYSAGFWLEGETYADTGASASTMWARRSTVSLTTPYGEVRIGRDYAASYLPFITFDIYGQRGIGTIEHFGAVAGNLTSLGAAASDIRNSNSVTYFTPEKKFGGFFGAVQYAFGEQSSSTVSSATISKNQGNYVGGSVGYAEGPLNAGAGIGKFMDVSRGGRYLTDYNVANFGVSYNFGFMKPLFLYQTERASGQLGQPDFRFDTISLGVNVPLGVHTIRGAYELYDNKTAGAAGSNDATKMVAGYLYNFSKRTAFYADIARLKNKGAATFAIGGLGGSIALAAPTPGGNSNIVGVGLRHAF